MIYNDKLAKLYGTFEDISSSSNLVVFKAKPNPNDYTLGFVNRLFAKKVNDEKIYEIDFENSKNINSILYKIVSIKWKISGPKNNFIKNGVLDKAGVTEQNKAEIDRIQKEEGVDLSYALPNLLEYWRGY